MFLKTNAYNSSLRFR